MCERKFGQILRRRARASDLFRKNRARREEDEMWLDAGFGVNSLVTDERLLVVARVRCQGKRMAKSHRIPLLEWGFTVWTAPNSLKTNNWRREWDSHLAFLYVSCLQQHIAITLINQGPCVSPLVEILTIGTCIEQISDVYRHQPTPRNFKRCCS